MLVMSPTRDLSIGDSFTDRLQAAKAASGNMSMPMIESETRIPVERIRGFLNGSTTPTIEECQELADAFGVATTYLVRPSCGVELVSYRKHSRLTKRVAYRVAIDIQTAFRNYYDIEEVVGNPLPNDILGEPYLVPSPDLTDDAIERIAIDMRAALGIGQDESLPDIHAALDAKVRLLPFAMPCGVPQIRQDGCVVKSDRGDKAVAFNRNAPIDRQRFTLAHELGHLILDDEHDEKSANKFAAAFLMPERLVKAAFNSDSLDALLGLKAIFGCSIAALNMRCNGLGLVNELTYKRNWVMLSYRGWSRHEPDVGLQQPQYGRYARLCLDGWITGRVTRSGLSELLGGDDEVPW